MPFFSRILLCLASLLIACLCLFPVLGFVIQWIYSGSMSVSFAAFYCLLCAIGLTAFWLCAKFWIGLFRSLRYRGP